MYGIQPRSLSHRELAHHCANLLELTTTGLPKEWQVELLRRYVLLEGELAVTQDELGHAPKQHPLIDPEAD